VQAAIREMTRRIVAHFHPDKVILFGSQARGDAGPDSDVELLVVLEMDRPKRAKMCEIRLALFDILVPMDILVTTPAEYERRRKLVGTIEWPASHERQVLYAR